jgi:hypothetical protein
MLILSKLECFFEKTNPIFERRKRLKLSNNNDLWGFRRLSQVKKQSQTKPIWGKGKSEKAKGKMRVDPEFLRRGYLKKQSQF